MLKYAILLAAPLVASCAQASADETATRADASVSEPPNATLALSSGSTPTAIAATHASASACPSGMVLVEGEYCPNVEQRCLEWMDPPGSRYEHFRCKRYAQPAVCHGARVHERFCIDATERTEDGTDVPRNHMSWNASKALCEASDPRARLCKTSEWQFACEGEEMRPYPYGWERSNVCNVDVMTGLGKVGRLVDHRTPASAHPDCLSAFGVHDMAGNVDEWATVDGAPKGTREVMKGSWWLPGRHACRSFQGGHNAVYQGTETGARCCRDAT